MVQDNLVATDVVGGLFAIAGLIFIFFPERVKKVLNANLRYHAKSRWTGEYTHGGLIFVRNAVRAIGVVLVIYGWLLIFRIIS